MARVGRPSTPDGWVNYRSSEEEPVVTRDILSHMVAQGWALEYSSWQALTQGLESDEITLNKLALISEVKPDGSVKHRLVWDLLRSNVNAHVQQGERVVLPPPHGRHQ